MLVLQLSGSADARSGDCSFEIGRRWNILARSPMTPEKIFEHASCFYQALNVLRATAPDPREDLHGAVTLAEPVVVLGALTTELFLKCLSFIETGKASHGHGLKELFDELSTETRARIEYAWESEIVLLRSKEWERIEAFGLSMPRDLRSALAKGSEAFKRIRYSYEGNTEGVHFHVGDLPGLLERLILEIRPQFAEYCRKPLPLPAPRH